MGIPPLIAHRLGRAYGPDSSRTALAGALAAGADGFEADVCLTADRELVLLHDPLLSLGTTLDGWAHERPARVILGARLRDRRGDATEEKPLNLDELLAATPPDLPIQVEVKAHADRELARLTARTICERYRRAPLRRRIELISFHSTACATAAAHGLRSRLVIWSDYAPEALAAWAHRRRVSGVSIEHFLLTPHVVRVMRLAGLSVNTGTVNEAALLERVIPLGPDAVCTDRPGELRAEFAASASAPPAAAASGGVPASLLA